MTPSGQSRPVDHRRCKLPRDSLGAPFRTDPLYRAARMKSFIDQDFAASKLRGGAVLAATGPQAAARPATASRAAGRRRRAALEPVKKI